MKKEKLTTLIGLFVLLSGCATSNNISKSQKIGPKGFASQFQAFSPLGDVARLENGLKITLGGDFLFKVGYSHLSKEGVQKIDSVAAALMKFPADHAAVMAYTDNRGKASRNLSLSSRRAASVKGELVKQGIPSDNITADGKGDADPVAPNDTPENMAKNRRIVILIRAF